jgi:hypothetical protein
MVVSGDGTAWRELASSYWYCVYAWWRRMGKDAAGAEITTLANFTHWIEGRRPQADDPGAARMREWVPARLMMFDEADLELRGAPPIEIDAAWAEQCYAAEPAGEADAIFQRRWALLVLEFTATTLRDEYAARGEEALFDELQPFAGFGQSDEERYTAAASRIGRTVGGMRKAVFDFRTRQRELLRAFVADTVLDPAEADNELAALLCAVEAASPASPTPGAGDAPSAATEAVLPPILRATSPGEMLARAMQTVRMTAGGAGIWMPPSDAEVARLFPQYEMLGILGRGGMGAVYKGRQKALDRFVAIKLLPLEISVDQDFADRFVREARAMAKLSHPNIIGVYDFGTTSEGHLYFVMEFIEGANLADMIHKVGLPPERALELAAQICTALAYAHSKGIVHRDIKPANVMVSLEGTVKVADFGLARLTDTGAEQLGHTMTGTVMGTPDYMAPEQKRGMAVDHRADIYSVGVMLYEMLCKETPHGVFEPPSQRAGCDPRVDPIVLKAMHRDPDRRYQSTTEMKADVETARTPVPAAPAAAPAEKSPAALVPVPVPAAKPARKKPIGLFAGLAAAVLALAAGVVLFVPKLRPDTRPATNEHPRAGAISPSPAASIATGSARPAAAVPGEVTPAAGKSSPAATAIAAAMAKPGNEKWVDSMPAILAAKGAVRAGDGKGASVPASTDFKAYLISRANPVSAQAVRATVRGEQWGLDVRMVPGTRGYEVQMRKDNRPFEIDWDDHGKTHSLASAPWPAGFDWNIPHTVELRAVGKTITAYLDGAKMLEVTDSNASSGYARIWVDGKIDQVIEHAESLVLDTAAPKPAAPAANSAAKPGDVLTFEGHRYQLVKEALTWEEASARAKAIGGHLATILSNEKNDWIEKNVMPSSPGTSDHYWIGGFRDPKDQAVVWKWVTGERVNLQLWGGTDNPQKDGLTMRGDQRWGDADRKSKLSFLVEWDDDGPGKPIRLWDSLSFSKDAFRRIEQWNRDAILRYSVRLDQDVRYSHLFAHLRTDGGINGYSLGIEHNGGGKIMVQLHFSPEGLAHPQTRLVKSWTLPRTYAKDEWIAVEFRAEGDQFTVSVDGTPLETSHDSTRPGAGYAAFVGMECELRDVTYIPLDHLTRGEGAATPAANASSTKAKENPDTPKTAGAGVRDLLAGVDVQRDSLLKTWRREGNVLRGPLEPGEEETIRLTPADVPANYDLRFRVSREHQGFVVRFPFVQGAGGGHVFIDGTSRALGRNAGTRGFANDASARQNNEIWFKAGVIREVVIQVRETGVTCLLDGQVILHADGRTAENGQADFHGNPSPAQHPFIGLSFCGGSITVHEATLQPVAGTQ